MIFVRNHSRKKFYTDFVLQHSSDQRKLINAAKSLFHQRNNLMLIHLLMTHNSMYRSNQIRHMINLLLLLP